MRYLNVDVFLEGDAPVEMGLWIRDKAAHKAEAAFMIGPGANTFTVDLDEMKARAELDRSHVAAICLFKSCQEEVTVYWDNLRVSEKPPAVEKTEPARMPDAELLSNGSFEAVQTPDALGNPFQWWNARRWQGRSFLGSGSNAVFSGRHSAMLDGRGPCKIGFFSPLVKVKSPTRLKLTAFVQTDGLQQGLYNQLSAIQVTDAAEHGLAKAAIVLPEGTHAWRKAELVFDVPDKCPTVKVFVQHLGPGRVWVDDISLTGTALDSKPGIIWTDTGRELKIDPPLITESSDLRAKRAAAEQAMSELRQVTAEAKAKGLETLYDEIPLVLGSLAFDVRWDLPEHLALREGYVSNVLQRCQASSAHLRDVMAGQAPDLKVPPHPDFAKLKLKGRYFCAGDEPCILFSMQYHDSGEFNLWRFTDYMKWASGEIHKGAPSLPVTTGGGEPFGTFFWRQGIDEEGLIREGANDVFLSETGSRALGVTSAMDLQRSLALRPTLILDPEYHARPNACFLVFLHGCGVLDYWWWPMGEGSFDDSALRHSPTISLEEVGVVMRTSLDVRRLSKHIAPFPDAPAQVGLLYSRCCSFPAAAMSRLMSSRRCCPGSRPAARSSSRPRRLSPTNTAADATTSRRSAWN